MNLSLLEHQKSSPFTKTINRVKTFFLKNSYAYTILKISIFISFWLLFSYIFYIRFPNNYRQPNFFGEEGNIFADNIIDHGFISAIITTFNGYFIWGIYILEMVAFWLNRLVYDGEFVQLARSFSIVSYAFLGLIATLPVALLRKYYKLPALILCTIFILFVPLGGWDYGIIGTLGNTKFALIFVSFLLIIKRHHISEKSKGFYLIDITLLICAYTNVTVYALLPFTLVRYWPKIKGGNYKNKQFKLIRRDRSFQSLIVLVFLLLPQLLIIKLNGVPSIPGYLDNPFNNQRIIEIFISRPFIYQLTFPINNLMSDIVVIAIFISFLYLFWRILRKERFAVILGLFSIFISTFLFVIKRTGISDFFISYQDAGPAQFFFPQNWIFAFLVSILIVELINLMPSIRLRVGVFSLIIIFFMVFMMPESGSFGRNDFQEKRVGNIYANARIACEGKEETLQIPIYPSLELQYKDLKRSQLCTKSVYNYIPDVIDLGLVPLDNQYLVINNDKRFEQKFRSPENGLSGLEVYFSTFTKRVKSPYSLTLYDESCKQKIVKVQVPVRKIKDNSYTYINFENLSDSKSQDYCFTINNSVSSNDNADLLAVQLSQPEYYTTGTTIIDVEQSSRDIVFRLRYKD